jgi:hypothetical protein
MIIIIITLLFLGTSSLFFQIYFFLFMYVFNDRIVICILFSFNFHIGEKQ